MQNYPPPGGFNQGQQGYNQGYNQPTQGYGGSGYNQPPQGGGQGYDSWQPNAGGQGNFGAQSNFGGQPGYGAPQQNFQQQPGGFPQQNTSQFNQGGAPAGYPGQQQQGGFGQQSYDAQSVPLEHLPPGYNPQTRAPYQAHELPAGAQPAGPGEEGTPCPFNPTFEIALLCLLLAVCTCLPVDLCVWKGPCLLPQATDAD